MSWSIVPQDAGKEGSVLCKHIRFFPMQKNGELRFMKLKVLLLQVVVKNQYDEFKCKLTISRHGEKYTFQHPDKMEHPIIRIGKRKIWDTLAPKERIAGEKMVFENETAFVHFLTRFMGTELPREIMGHFAEKLAEIKGLALAA